jgi:Ca2+-binding RTX toxin-like protein
MHAPKSVGRGSPLSGNLNFSRSSSVGEGVRNSFLAGLLAATAVVVVLPASSQASVVTCQGKDATIVGPTGPNNATTGTEGDDVIVAPLANGAGSVQALGGNDTICMVGGDPSDAPSTLGYIPVEAGDGDDSVLNQNLSQALNPYVTLGAGADHYVGNDYGEFVFAGGPGVVDTDVDVMETLGGVDVISSGGAPPGTENHDVIFTGAGADGVTYANASGGHIDNGTGADSLSFTESGAITLDNTQRRLSVGDRTLLTWTNIDRFGLTSYSEDSFSFVGTDADESLAIRNFYQGVTPRGGSISTGGGNDTVYVESYLPRNLDLGTGKDALNYKMNKSCGVASIVLDASADCTTLDDRHVVTRLAGIERLDARTQHRLNVRGTSHRDVITARSPVVRVHVEAGSDQVLVDRSHDSEVWGGHGNDELMGSARKGIVLHGSRGDDVLNGGNGPDRLYGGSGRDVASGLGGKDFCVAEIQKGCELPR